MSFDIEQFYSDDERARRRVLFSRRDQLEASASHILRDLAAIDAECSAQTPQNSQTTERSDV